MKFRYIRNGQMDDAAGTGVTVHARAQDGWLAVSMENMGYMGVEITEAEYNEWLGRIANPDMETYFPGVFPGIGVVSKKVYEGVRAAVLQRWQNAQSVTPRQARQWLIGNDLDEALEAGILAIGASGLPEDVKQSKLMWNWYEYSTEWQYKNEHLTAAFAALGIDKDQFFAEAKLL